MTLTVAICTGGRDSLIHAIRSLANQSRPPDHLLIVEIDKSSRGYKGERNFTLLRELSSRMSRVPGVQAVTFSENGIFSGTESSTTLQVGGFVARTSEDSVANYDRIGPNYVHAIGGRIVQGRDITAEDIDGSDRVVLVNQTMANFYFKGRSALGEFLRLDDSIAVRIVGVVADTRDHSLDGEAVRRFYLPIYQNVMGDADNVRFEVRASGDPATLAKPIREAILAVDPLLRIEDARPLSYLMRQSIREELLLARLSSAFGFLALLLASFGLYGVLTYAVTRRTGEIGLRVALGAQRGTVVRMILRDALMLVGVGVIVGAPLSILGGRLLRNQLHGIEGIDPISIAVALTALITAAVIAALLPALRASRVAPLTALREN